MPKSSSRRAAAFQEVKNPSSSTTSSLSRLRKKIRDLERLLKRAQQAQATNGGKNTTALAHREQERALKALKLELASAEAGSQAKRLERRYHQVRFVERRKADRKVTKARKALDVAEKAVEEAGGDKATKKEAKKQKKEAERQLRLAEHELTYIVCFPETERYVSLYVDGGLERMLNDRTNIESENKTDKKRREWWDASGRMLENGEVNVDSLMFGYRGQKSWKAAAKPVVAGIEDEQGSAAEEEMDDAEEAGDEDDDFFEK
ncbi:hypothetical protein BZA70DRAFT_287714 [Myxozyma melibiosi]|uniref:rRNA-processing protein EFG1 n=1 Tax=Myxozyma melibiosi TaxID=54550 RepID=A0ABR1FF05_9ASCO